MIRRLGNGLLVMGGAALLLAAAWLASRPSRLEARASTGAVDTEKVVHYIRARFGIADTVKLTVGPLASSELPGFYQAIVAVDYGEQNKARNTSQSILVSKDQRYLVVGAAYPLEGNAKAGIEQRVRDVLKVPPAVQVAAGPIRRVAQSPTFNEVEVTFSDGKNKPQSQKYYVSKNDRVFVIGQVFELTVDPRREALRVISTQGQPSVGPASAPVTIVEYADLQCPSCAHFNGVIENDVLPKYGNKIRVIFKEFPLPMHDWSAEAAVANECAYQIKPSAFFKYRSLIFSRQSSFSVANVHDLLLQYGQEAGVDRLKLAACLDSKASLPRIEAARREANQLGVVQTPTSFVNGRIVVGAPPTDELYKIIDEALIAKKD